MGAFEVLGRDEELARVRQLATLALVPGGAGVAVVVGDPGIGKTALLDTAAEELRVGCRTVRGYARERMIPFAAAAELVRDARPLAGEVVPEELVLLEAVHRRLRRSPHLLLVDDAQWLDERTVALLHYLVRGASEGRGLLVLVATRPDPEGQAVARSLAAIVDVPQRWRCELSGLGRAAGTRLARRLDPLLDEAAATERWRRAGGSPFWLAAMSSPGGGARLLREWLVTADADAIELFVAAVAAGRPWSSRWFEAVLDWPVQRLEAAASGLATAGLLRRSGGDLVLAHDLIRELGESEVPAAPLRDLHARWAAVLEEDGTSIGQLQLALAHRRRAGLSAEELARRILAHPRRGMVGRAGLGPLIAELRAAPSQQQRELGDLARDLGERAVARDRYTAAAEGLEGRAKAEALLGAAQMAHDLGEPPEDVAALVRAVRATSRAPEVTLQADLLESELLRWGLHRSDEAASLTTRVLGQLDRVDVPPQLRFEAIFVAWNAAMIRQDLGEVRRLAAQLRTIGTGVGGSSYRRALAVVTDAADISGDLRRAIALAAELTSEARVEGDPVALLRGLRKTAYLLLELGRPLEAADVVGEAVTLEARVGRRPGEHRAEVVAAATRLSIADWRAAVAELRGIEEDEPDPHFRLSSQVRQLLALSRFEDGEAVDELGAVHRRIERDMTRSRCPRCGVEVAARTVEAWALRGRPELARETAERLGRATVAEPRLLLLRDRAMALLGDDGDAPRRAAALAATADRAEASHYRAEAWWIRIDEARLRARVSAPEAVTILRGLAADASARGAQNEAALADQVLRGLGVRTWKRGAASPDPRSGQLTERELAVVRLVASGASNAEIAATLFLSRKTIERHVSSALRKLSVRNRTELATRVRELGLVVEGAPS